MSQRVSKVGNIKYALSGDDRFVASVEPGETFVVECAINVNDGTIRHLGQLLTEADVTLPFVNGATGPIEVRGSKVGDMLKVEIVKMELDNLGFTALWPGIGMFPDWVRRKEFGRQTRVVEVKNDLVHWNEHVKLPIKPMIGVIADVRLQHNLFFFTGLSATIDEGPDHISNFSDVRVCRDVITIRQHKSRKPIRIRLKRILQIMERHANLYTF